MDGKVISMGFDVMEDRYFKSERGGGEEWRDERGGCHLCLIVHRIDMAILV